ncbi:hypothetical protein KJ359_002649 [Pestalotiopsis sp. 9143b]|nr:hypothetical protein KJ359_002649 [Pestalotiopsis sp. 9143b]
MAEQPIPADPSKPVLATAPQVRGNELKTELPPINNVEEAFRDILRRALDQDVETPFPDLLGIAKFGGFKINVSTMCSGTDAPIFALKMLANEFFAQTGVELFRFHQQFAVEIEPYKQSYIRRNTDAVVFRDVRDFASKDLCSKQVMTALGSMSQVPYDRPHILIVGTSCVSFSNLNTAKQKNFGGAAAVGLHGYLEKMRARNQDADHSRVGGYLSQIVENLDMSSESDATFFPVLSFILHQRPTFVIFENVLEAPWADMENIFLPAVGYSAGYTSCDTKNYYLPQTRQRKYLVAFDTLEFGKEKAKAMAEDTVKFLLRFDRRASTDVEKFLYMNTDKATQLDIQQLEFERNSKIATREAPWFFSKQRHEKVRQKEQLGYAHPFSGLKPTGEHTFYDRANKTIMNRQSNRVKDVTDISLLRGLTAVPSFDPRFKTKVYDHSQNIDRTMAPVPSGVSGCLTPGGMAFISNQSRYVTGREYLQLQGLPVNALSLSKETTDQLKNLAGNAMTTTVVGATFLSAIMAMRKNDPKKKKQFPRIDLKDKRYKGALSAVPEPAIVSSVPERACDVDLSSYVEATTGQMIELAQRVRPYCYCTGTAMYSSAILWKCQTCDAIRCGNCKGNPKHEYKKLELVPEAFGQETAELMLMLHLPKVLHNVFSAGMASQLLRNLDKSWQAQSDHDDISSMLQTDVFYFNCVHRSETISVSYNSSSGFELKVMIDASSVTWYLFIDAHSTIGKKMVGDSSNENALSVLLKRSSKPTGQHLREFCLRGLPIARAQITVRSLASIPTDQQWVPWSFEKPSRTFNGSEISNIQVSVEKDDVGVLTIELIPDETSFVTPAVQTVIQSVLGSWEPKPDCDVAESSLYVRKYNDDSDNLFLFKDPSRIGPAELDTFVLSKNPQLIQWHEHREVLLSFVPLKGNSGQLHKLPAGTYTMLITMDGYWESSDV